jgi:DNA polymerase
MAELMFIGEGPGFNEDQQGRPFVGKAGDLLTKIIEAMQFQRGEVFIGNVVKCRPPQNRQPEPDEMETCLPYLHRQIDVLQPKAIVLLGRTALMGLMPDLRDKSMTAARGRWLDFHGIPVMPTYHPAYLLRNASAKRLVWEDMKQVMAFFGRTAPGKGG